MSRRNPGARSLCRGVKRSARTSPRPVDGGESKRSHRTEAEEIRGIDRAEPPVANDGSIEISAPTPRLRTMATHEQDYWDSVVTDVRSLLFADAAFDVVSLGATLGPRSLERVVRAAGLDVVETTAVMHGPRAIALAHRPRRRGLRRRTERVWRQAALPLIEGRSP